MLKNQKGLNNHSLSIATGIPYTTIDGWYKKGYDRIKLTTLKTLCQFFNVSLDFLIDGEDGIKKAPAGAEAIHIDSTMNKYAQLDEHGKQVVAAVTDIEYMRCKGESGVQLRAARGGGFKTDSLPIEYIEGSDTSDLDS